MRRLLTVLLLAATAVAAAKEQRTEHTFRLADGAAPPMVSLDQLSILQGIWRGEAFGNTFEAAWLPPSAGSMVGTFKLMDGDSVVFYELLVLTADSEGRLGMRVKHFTAEFVAWEDKADFTHFKIVDVEPDALHFSGISFYRRGENAMDAYILMRRGETISEEKLTYRRVE